MKITCTLSFVNLLLSLAVCVYASHHGWRPSSHLRNGRSNRYENSEHAWETEMRKRDQLYLYQSETVECCPSVEEITQPFGGVSRSGRILELFRDQNYTQSFYWISCKPGVHNKPCRFVGETYRRHSVCVQKYSYTYALVRDLHSHDEFRLDYIRTRSGCSCEILLKKNHHAKSRYAWPVSYENDGYRSSDFDKVSRQK